MDYVIIDLIITIFGTILGIFGLFLCACGILSESGKFPKLFKWFYNLDFAHSGVRRGLIKEI